MFFLLPILILGVAAYFVWRHFTSSLTRECRWRLDRAEGQWRCAACGAVLPAPDNRPPRICGRSSPGR